MGTFVKDSSQQKNDVHSHFIYRDYPRIHNHDYWEFFVVVDGAYKHTLNGKITVIKKDFSCLLRPQTDYHGIINYSNEPASHLNILIRDSFMRSVCTVPPFNISHE